MEWLLAHWMLIVSVMLGVSESLALIFPSDSGFGGILAGLIKVLKAVGPKDPMAK